MLKTLKLTAEGHKSRSVAGSFSGTSNHSMASSECGDEIALPNLMQKDLQQSPLFNKMFKDLLSSHCGSQNCGLNSQSLSESECCPIPIQNSCQPTASSGSPPSNLFQVGFQDCAVEVLRFLEEQEKMDVQNPLVQGLRSHLMNVSKSISDNDLSLAPSSVSADFYHSSDLNVPLRSSSPVLTESITKSSCQLNRTEFKKSNESVILRRKRPLGSSIYSSPASTLSSSSSSSLLLPQNDTSFVNPAKRGCFILKTHDEPCKIPPLSYLASKAHTENSYFSVANRVVSSSTGTEALATSPVTLPLIPSPVPTFKTTDKTLCTCHSSEMVSVRFPSDLAIPTQSEHCAVHENISSRPSLVSSPLLSPSITQTVDPVSDISTVTSDNLEDVLLSVESCQSHEDPRVRTLASRIINLIHHIDEDEEDDNVDDGENEEIENDQDCEENRHDLEDSGIDLEEE